MFFVLFYGIPHVHLLWENHFKSHIGGCWQVLTTPPDHVTSYNILENLPVVHEQPVWSKRLKWKFEAEPNWWKENRPWKNARCKMEKHSSIIFLVSGTTVGSQHIFLNKWMREGWVSLGNINLKLGTLVIWLPKIWGIVGSNPNNLLKEDIL